MYLDGCSSIPLDIRDEHGIQKTMEKVRPRWVLHAAAMTNVDDCEKNPDEARKVNALAAANVAAAARDVRAGFVYISSDAAFDGSRGNYNENDPPSPVNCYGASKVLGEEMVQRVVPSALVVRTNLYGWSSRTKLSYSEWLLEKMRQGTRFPVFQDVHFNPLLTNTLAEMILKLAHRQCGGIVHLGNSTPCSKLEFARAVAKTFEVQAENLIQPIKVDEAGLGARRPHNTVLNCERAQKLFGCAMPNLEEDLARMRGLPNSELTMGFRMNQLHKLDAEGI